MPVPIYLIAKDGPKTTAELDALIAEHEISGTLYAADFYVEGSERWELAPGGWHHPSGRVVNVDHHAPHPAMQRHVSSGNLALTLLEDRGQPGPDDAIAISHIDCDSILSAGILSGRLEPKSEYGEAAIAADHTGIENEIADLLQGLDAHFSRMRRGPPSLDTVEYLFECLASLEAGTSLPDHWDGFAEDALRHRRASRERAEEVARERMQNDGPVQVARLGADDGPIEGELFLPHVPGAWLVATTSPHADHAGRFRWKVRLGLGAPSWLSLHELGIRAFDPVFGGRWNAGSNSRPSGKDEATELPGSPLDPDTYHRHLVEAVHARVLERAIAIAVDAHRGQRDKAGAPYILHPLRVMAACSSIDAKIVGILHDVVEDGDGWTLGRLREEGFGPEVVAGVEAVTKNATEKSDAALSEGENDERYLAFCRRAAGDPIGREVKRADLMDNMDLSRLAEVTEKDRRRLERYRRALEVVS